LSVKLQSTDGSNANGTVTFTTEKTSLAAKGSFDLSRDHFLEGQAKLTLQTEDLEPYLLQQGIALPQTGSGLPISVSADVATTPEAIAFTTVEGRADNNGFAGALTIDRKVPGKAEGQINLATLDLAWLAEGILGPVQNMSSGALSKSPVAQAAWTGLNVALDVQAANFWPGFYGAIGNFAGKMEWKGDEIAFTEATGDWLGGKLEGRVQLGNANGSGFLRSRLDVKGGDLAQAGWMGAGAPVATGIFDLSVALEASGANAEAMAHSASGSGTATFNGVTLNGVNSGALPQLMATADGLKTEISADAIRQAAEAAVFSGQSVVGVVKVPFSIAGGVLRAQNVAAADGNAAFAGEASFDLAAERIDAGIDMTFRAGDEALTGAEPRVRLGFAGLLASPGVSLDVADLSNFLSLRAFERERRRVETLQANVLEKQRLRREVQLYKAKAQQREIERLRAIAEERRRAAAAAEAERVKADLAARAEAARKAAEEAARAERERQQQQQLGAPSQVQPGTGEGEAPQQPSGQGLNFDVLPDV
ncbi:MAG: AsmA family protein, partial [Sphingomonadaceae bacterium]